MTICRYFGGDSDATWDAVRATLDAAWGFPDERTTSCALPASQVPHDAQGRPLIGVPAEWCEWPDVAALLPGLLASGQATEITEEQHRTSWVRPDDLIP
jgi:hypothetical protein